MKNNEEAGVNYKLEGVQVLQIIVNDSNNIEAVYLERMTNESDTLSDTVASIRFKRTTDGHWLENGLSHVKTDKTGTFSVVWDDSIGKLSIKYPE